MNNRMKQISEKQNLPHTQTLYPPYTTYRKPNHRSQQTSSDMRQLELVTAHGCIAVDLDHPLVLGRQPHCTENQIPIDLSFINVAQTGISRTHATLEQVNGQIHIKDHNSLNGTYLNKTELYPMRDYVVQDGDVLMLGDIEIQIRFVT